MEDNRNAIRYKGDVYRHIYKNKASSRQMIAADLGLSLPTVTMTLHYLMEEGLIYHAGEFESTGGRKASMISIVPGAGVAVGIDVTRSALVLVLVNLELEILDLVKMHITFEDTEEYYETINVQLEQLLKRNQVDRDRLLGVGISLPAIISEEQNVISYATVINLPDDFYERMCGKISYPVRLFNDANSAGWAELQFKRNKTPMVYLSLSNSVGGAVILNRVYTGNNWRGGEFGHMTVVPNGKKCYCGSYGCLDAYCSAWVLSDFTGGDIHEFFQQMKKTENRGYWQVFREYMEHLSVAVNNLRMCFDCDVVLGGSVGACMEDYLEEFREITKARTPFEDNADYVKICSFRTEPSAVGAALYYVDRFVKDM